MGRHGQLDASKIPYAERDDDIEINGEMKNMAIRNPIKQETAEELAPILYEYLKDGRCPDEPEIFITEDRLPRDRQPPAGYYKKAKDHVVDVIVFRTKIKQCTIDDNGTAENNIEDLREAGYGENNDE